VRWQAIVGDYGLSISQTAELGVHRSHLRRLARPLADERFHALKSRGAFVRRHLGTARAGGSVRTQVIKGRPPNAELRYEIKAHHAQERLSLLDIALITGKTHQIRVQATSRQHPLAGDDVYGDFSMNKRLRQSLGLKRLALHAHRLEFKHPASGLKTAIEAPVPEDLAGVFGALGFAC
jgi:hypothetical protein